MIYEGSVWKPHAGGDSVKVIGTKVIKGYITDVTCQPIVGGDWYEISIGKLLKCFSNVVEMEDSK